MTRIALIFLIFAVFVFAQESDYSLIYHDTFENGAENWQPLFPQNWQVIQVDGESAYELKTVGESAAIRKPKSMSILTPYSIGNFELQVRAKCYTDPSNTRRDICLFFGCQDDVHFYYVHFSGVSDAVHNAIHIVNNADRLKINLEAEGESKALLTQPIWYTLQVNRDVESGLIEAFVDGELVMSAVDTTFKSGKIGLGSFDDTGAFCEVKLWGELVETKVGSAVQPHDFELSQNYPNPFNPETRIQYTLGTAEDVQLDVYDVRGRLLNTLVDQQQAAGEHSVTFNAATLPSGVYVYKLLTPTFADAKKMTVVE